MKRRAAILVPVLLFLLGSSPGSLRAAAPAQAAAISVPAPAAIALLETSGAAPESSHEIFTWVNFLILVAGLAYVLRKPLSDFFGDRLDSIHEELEKGREAMRASDAKLAEVERKINNLEKEIAEFRANAERDMQAEAARLEAEAESEAQRILEFAQAQIGAAARASEAELRRFAARQAVQLAEDLIRQRLDEPARRSLVSRFAAGVKGSAAQN